MDLVLTLRVDSPAGLHESRASVQFARALDYIPGSALRGAMAARYLKGNPSRASEPTFVDLFLSDRVVYPDLFPAAGGRPWRLLPATARACKRHGAGKEAGGGHPASVTDALLRLELAEILHSQKPLEEQEICPECRLRYADRAELGKRDRLAGYAVALDPFVKGEVAKRLLTGTAVDRTTGAVAPGLLFSQDVVEEGEFFQGVFRLDSSRAEGLRTALESLLPRGVRLYLGYGRSRGLGHMTVIGWEEAQSTDPPLPKRWEAFNRAIARFWNRYKVQSEGRYFSLTLQSHLALRDNYLRPVLENIMPAHLGLDGAERRRCVVNAVTISGWNAAVGLPKPDTRALARGSVLLFRVPRETEATTLSRLEMLEADGAGERRAEGFGELRVCDEFHYHYLLKETEEAT